MSDIENENSDLSQLEQLLDGELAESAAGALAQRLAEDETLAAMLQSLQAERAQRDEVFGQYLPSQAMANAFAQRALGTIRRQSWHAKWNRTIRVAGSAAACILVGFVTGWSGRGHTDSPAPGGQMVHAGGSGGSLVAVANHSNANQSAQQPNAFFVELTDASGHAVATQRFDNMADAQAFARDVTHVQSTPASAQDALPLPGPQYKAQRPLVVPVSDGY